MASVIYAAFSERCVSASDIYMHLPTLRKLSAKCDTIAEFGVRGIVSTWAFLAGLLDGSAETGSVNKKKLICVDIEPIDFEHVQKTAAEVDIDAVFIECDSATVKLPHQVDMLFIDTWHIYGHLKRELAAHHENVRMHIVMHDTEVDGVVGESVRLGLDCEKQAEMSGYPIDEIKKGLKLAVDEFLVKHGDEWVMTHHFMENNGLTVLTRRSSMQSLDSKI
jgi:hypothetical protein